MNDLDRAYFGRGDQEKDTIGFLDAKTRAIFGRSYAAEPDVRQSSNLGTTTQLRRRTRCCSPFRTNSVLLYNAHVMEAILTTVAPALGWR